MAGYSTDDTLSRNVHGCSAQPVTAVLSQRLHPNPDPPELHTTLIPLSFSPCMPIPVSASKHMIYLLLIRWLCCTDRATPEVCVEHDQPGKRVDDINEHLRDR